MNVLEQIWFYFGSCNLWFVNWRRLKKHYWRIRHHHYISLWHFSSHTKIWLLNNFKTPFLFIFFVALKSPRNLSIICHGYKDDNLDKFTTITKIFFYSYSSQVPKMNCGLMTPFYRHLNKWHGEKRLRFFDIII